MKRIAILGSTRGTSMLHMLQIINEQSLPITPVLVVSNVQDAMILERAHHMHIPAKFVDPKGLSRVEFDKKISALLKEFDVELIVLVGYMRILSAEFCHEWERKIINVHPSLLPEFPGLMDLQVHQAVLDAGKKESGCTVHFVTDVVDGGPIVWQEKCEVLPNDTAETLKARVQALEAKALVAAILKL